MSLPFKPHRFRFFLQSPRLNADRVIEGYDPLDPGVELEGCGQQVMPGQSYDIFGREIDNGMAFYVDVTNLARSVIKVGGTIEFDGNLIFIEKVQINEQGLPSDHIAVYGVMARH